MDESFEDKREFERFLINVPIMFMCLDSDLEYQGEVINISPIGIGLITNAEVGVNSSLALNIQIPDGGLPLYTRGYVVWANKIYNDKYKIGIMIQEVDLLGMSRVLRATHKVRGETDARFIIQESNFFG
ncbi:MAG: PilZ domain-containing protein [Candidatus Omnitrophota bacterium]